VEFLECRTYSPPHRERYRRGRSKRRVRRAKVRPRQSRRGEKKSMERQIIHVEPLSGYLARFGAPVSPVVRHGGLIYVSGLPPFDPSTSEVRRLPLERQAEIVIDQMALCLAAAGASPRSVLNATSIARLPTASPPSTRSTPEPSRSIRPPAFSSASPPGPARSTSRSTAWPRSTRADWRAASGRRRVGRT
jgi:enamine deaminase RidA (YjgF/YER057c/UK114 family)